MEFDAVVAGAGPAGASLAGWLGRAGLKVLLADKARFPRPKACGEGVLPPGAEALAAMGLWEGLSRRGRVLEGLRYHAGAAGARCAFPAGRPALGVERFELDSALARWAAACGNVRFEEGVRADEPLWEGGRPTGVLARSRSGAAARWRAPLLVCAQGLHSSLSRRLGVRIRRPARRRMALVARLDRVAAASADVEVFLGDGQEAYLTPVAGGVNAALLFDDDGRPCDLFSRLRALEGLGPRLSGSRLCGPALAWGPLGAAAEGACGDGFLLAGDSALALDPISGEGVSLALAAAREGRGILARAAASGGAAASLKPFDELRRSNARTPLALSRLLLAVSRRGWLRGRAVSVLGRRPEAFARLLSAASGERGLGLPWPLEAARLALG